MTRFVVGLSIALAAGVLTAGTARAALEITLSVSPAEGIVGRSIEVLVRTYAPVGAGDVGLPTPSIPYPAPSGLWNVLYPIPDYPFDVVARSPTGANTKVVLARDSSDASLWRGSFTPDAAGEWSIGASNFPTMEPTRLLVRPGEVAPQSPIVGIAALIGGLVFGVIVGMGIRRSRPSSVPRS
jgi:hypothetical protein